jgi:fatty acid/phospholipid biosynthesis enzyme
VDGAVLIGHGGSSAKAIEGMVLRAVETVEQGVPARIAEALATPAA